jgi:CDP-diacylglycerol--glycerol-3-phosphate 3-phosphatidyltransferase
MHPPQARILLVTALTLLRPVAALVFACLAFQDINTAAVLSLYALAAGSDLLDGYVARRLCVTTFFGRVVDLIGDKALTVVSLLYAAARDIDIRPLALIAVREIVVLGARILVVDGAPLLSSSRILGGALAVALWGTTAVLISDRETGHLHDWISLAYWFCSLAMLVNLAVRIVSNWRRIMASALENG